MECYRNNWSMSGVPDLDGSMNESGLVRSRSFTNGFSTPTNQNGRKNALDDKFISASCSKNKPMWDPPVLGQTLRSSTNSLRSSNILLNLATHSNALSKVKVPKAPRVQRALLMFETVNKGLRDCIAATEDDICAIKCSTEEMSVNSQQQLKAADRYLKRLEYHLAKLDELQDIYSVQQKLRDGVRTMAHAYVGSLGRGKDSALNKVRSGFRECTDNMCLIEAQLERMMGTFHLAMKDIQGFARICPGDIFDVAIRHGEQKWKSRCRVLKDGRQSWFSQRTIFKVQLGEVFAIKATEVKGLGKSLLLGNKYCETRDLFCSHPQLMTVNLNSSGSLKLNVVVTWNPLEGSSTNEGGDGIMLHQLVMNAPNSLSSPQLHKRSTLPNYMYGMRAANQRTDTLDSVGSSRNSSHSVSAPSSTLSTPDTDCKMVEVNGDRRRATSTPKKTSSEILLNSAISPLFKADGPNGDKLSETDSSADLSSITNTWSSHDSHVLTEEASNGLSEVVHSLALCLEDIRGKYEELRSLEESISQLELFLRKKATVYEDTSPNMSTAIESALEAFSFLNSVDVGTNGVKRTKMVTDGDDKSVASSSGTSDSSTPPSTGSEEMDIVLTNHLTYCHHLIECLGNFGPMKCREIDALEKLRQQSAIIDRLVKGINQADNKKKVISPFVILHKEPQLLSVWDQISDGLYVTLNQATHKLIPVCQYRHPKRHPKLINKCVKLLLTRINDSNKFDMETVLTVYQFRNYFRQTAGHTDFHKHFEELADEVNFVQIMNSSDGKNIVNTVSSFSGQLPQPDVLRAMAKMLVPGYSIDQQVQAAIKNFLQDTMHSPFLRKQIILIYVECLESETALLRQAGCLALLLLQACECIDQLAFICQTDNNSDVRAASKEALYSFGDEGRKIFDQNQLSSNGFQGLNMK